MLRRDLIKNKIYGMVFIVLGALTIPIEWDATFFLFTLMLGILLFVSRENCIMNIPTHSTKFVYINEEKN